MPGVAALLEIAWYGHIGEKKRGGGWREGDRDVWSSSSRLGHTDYRRCGSDRAFSSTMKSAACLTKAIFSGAGVVMPERICGFRCTRMSDDVETIV